MGKRSNFDRIPRDFYPTPYEAVTPLLPHLPQRALFAEPCAGDGRLIDHLKKAGHVCVWACDLAASHRRPAYARTYGVLLAEVEAEMMRHLSEGEGK